jgi:very-short-patch-repair endonuclease
MKHYPHYIIDLARQFRKNPTKAEEKLWERLRNRKLAGLKFRRQHHFGRYVADFYCAELYLVVELEGNVHEDEDQKEYDDYRFACLEARGLHSLRFRNEEVLNEIEEVLKTILDYKNASGTPSPGTGEGAGGEGQTRRIQ